MGQTMKDLGEGLGESLTHPGIPFSQLVPEDKSDDTPALAVGKHAARIALGIPEFLTSAAGIGTMAVAPLAPALVSGAFTADMLHSLGKQIQEVIPNWDKMSTAQQAGAVTDMGGTAIMAMLTGAHATTGALNKFVPARHVADMLNKSEFTPEPKPGLPLVQQGQPSPAPPMATDKDLLTADEPPAAPPAPEPPVVPTVAAAPREQVYFHGTKAEYHDADIATGKRMFGIHLTTDESVAKTYGKVKQFTIDPQAKILDLSDGGDLWAYMVKEGIVDKDQATDVDLEGYATGGKLFQYDISSKTHLADDVARTAKDQGYDVVKMPDDLDGKGDNVAHVIVNPKVLKSPSSTPKPVAPVAPAPKVEAEFPKIVSQDSNRGPVYGVQTSKDYVAWTGSKGSAESWLRDYQLRKPEPTPPPAAAPAPPANSQHPVISNLNWARENIPWGERGTTAPELRYKTASALRDAGFRTGTQAEEMAAGERPFPTREDFEKSLETNLTLVAMERLSKVESELRDVGLNPREAKLPNREDFKTAEEFWQAAYDLEGKMRTSGASAFAGLVRTGQTTGFRKPTKATPAPPASSVGLSAPVEAERQALLREIGPEVRSPQGWTYLTEGLDIETLRKAKDWKEQEAKQQTERETDAPKTLAEANSRIADAKVQIAYYKKAKNWQKVKEFESEISSLRGYSEELSKPADAETAPVDTSVAVKKLEDRSDYLRDLRDAQPKDSSRWTKADRQYRTAFKRWKAAAQKAQEQPPKPAAEAKALEAKQQPGLVDQPAAPEKGIASDWTSATDEAPPIKPGEQNPPSAGLVNPPTGPTELQAGISIPKFANRKMSPLDKVTASHSGKIQKSFDEARRAQREIKAAVPSERRQNAISIWREAKGDAGTLKGWATAAKGKMFRQAAIDAQTLTPKEIAIATKVGAAFDALHTRGITFDVLRSHRDAYVPHVWDVAKPGTGFGTGMLKQRFRFSKARTFDTFFDGDQAGFKPKTLAIGKLLPAYIHEMNKVIADRQAVRDIASGVNKDGSPMAVPRGNAKAVEGDNGQAVLVQPRAMKEADTSDYRVMSDQPALANWTWASKDTAGNPVFIKSDLALHPDTYRRINAMIGQSAIRQWYHDPVTGTAQIPRAIVRGLDTAQSAMKREMFGLLAPFHQVQEGWHGIGHWVNPFSHIPKVDLRDPAQLDAANHGLMLLPDRASSRVYLEGVGTKSSLLSQGIRKVGRPGEAVSDVIDGYQDYLFHQYIPGLKFKTYEALLSRNMKRYAAELKSGEMTPADVKITSAEQANAAYGHLNNALLDRNPTIQHLIQLSLLAPDFLEARTRFVGQAVKGLSSPVGVEQFKAIAILAAVQAASAYVIANVTGGQYDPHHPFEVIHGGRRYFLRSVPEDIFAFLKDTRQFIYGRVNPLLVKGGIQLGTGLNYRGEKVSALDTFTELLAGYIPITARQLPGLRSLTETSRQNPVSPLQQLAGSLGLRISRYSPVSETYKLAGKWMDAQKIDRAKGSYPISKYQQLRYALEDGDLDRAKTEYDSLIKTATPGKIAAGFKSSINHPFTGKTSTDADFAKTLTGYDKELYNQALRTRTSILNSFNRLPGMRGTSSRQATAPAAPSTPPWYKFE